MPAMIDDPTARPNARWPPEETPAITGIVPRRVMLGDGTTRATILPFTSQHQVSGTLLSFLCQQLNDEIEAGDTYPMVEAMPLKAFGAYWFQNFAAVMLLGDDWDLDDRGCLRASRGEAEEDWRSVCLGSYYVKPNYPGRSSHVCNAGFLVSPAARGRRVGRLLGESYVSWAPRLGYEYSVFNLVYETNVASCRIWDALGFQRIGRVPGCARLRSFPDRKVDAIIYGRVLSRDEANVRTDADS